MDFTYVCADCGKKYDPGSFEFRCSCGGLFDLEKSDIDFSDKDIIANEWSLFRYLKALPFRDDFAGWSNISMGEGSTPLARLDRALPNVFVKVDYMMPTLSFKDRGAVVVIAKAKEYGVTKVIQDSSGNAGKSIAAYAKRAGIDCEIFVPATASPKKVEQISAFGAEVHAISGTREDTANAALARVTETGGFYASHVYNPFFYEGTKTYAYEIYEQTNGKIPDVLVIPVGNGTLLIGAYYGFTELIEFGLIEKIPKLIAVQAERCAPLHAAYYSLDPEKAVTGETIAEGIAITEPKRKKRILDIIKRTEGEIILAPEHKIAEAKNYLAERGFFVENTTAATFAGFFDYYGKSGMGPEVKIVIPLCGHA